MSTVETVNGNIDSGFVRNAKGVARTTSSQIDLTGGLLSGLGCTVAGLGASCDGAKAEVDADNDSGTAPPDTDQDGPTNAAAGSLSAGSILTIGVGSGQAQAQATARSCWSCQPGGSLPVGDDDRLPYFIGTATGPGAVTVGVLSGVLNGSLLSIGSNCVGSCASAKVDRNDSPPNQRIKSTVSTGLPAVNLLSLIGGPAGGLVQVSAASVNATAEAGPGAGGPTVGGTVMTVKYWNGLGYTTAASITPGVASSATIPSMSLLLGAVTVSGTVTANKSVTSQSASGGAVTSASASLTNWLFVDLNVSIVGLGSLNLHLDYGRIAASAGYQPVS